jgi:predicted nucleic acid-binding protein
VAIHFLDSSSLVKRYVSETGSAWVLSLVGAASGNQNYVARISGAEVVAAVARRSRAGGLSVADTTAVMTAFRHDFQNEYRIVEITPTLIEAAMALAETHAIRGYDAVQLAAVMVVHAACLAMGTTVTLISADVALNAAATMEGVAVEDPNLHP